MIKKEVYSIEGMTCSGCERAINRAISNLDGVQSAKVDLQHSSVSVEFDPGKINIDAIKSAVNKIGYKFVGVLPSYGQKANSDEAIP